MLFRGSFIALGDSDIKRLRSERGDPSRRACLLELEESAVDVQATDKAWYILFNCFHNSRNEQHGAELHEGDLSALDLLFVGARKLHRADFYVINWIPKRDVPKVALALQRVSPACLRERYFNVNRGWFHTEDYAGSAAQCEYVLHWFEAVRSFFKRQALAKRHVVFSAQYQ